MPVESTDLSDIWPLIVWGASLCVAAFTSLFFERVVHRLTARTETEVDDLIARHVRLPLALTVAFLGTWYAVTRLNAWLPDPWIIRSILATVAVALWTTAIGRIAVGVLGWLAARTDRNGLVTPRTLPVFDIGARTVIYGGAVYFLFLAWNVDLTAWMASAGVVGIAVGFAAKDTIANLFAGVFILADVPYKLGDYLVLDSGERGRVTEIGIRATRILTRDDVEVIIPNAIMAGTRIINQSTPSEAHRTRIKIEVAYGSDVDKVRALLHAAPVGVEGYFPEKSPRVRFREFGASGIKFELMFWVERPELRGRAVDATCTRIYKTFAAEGIVIPSTKYDVTVRQVAEDVSAP